MQWYVAASQFGKTLVFASAFPMLLLFQNCTYSEPVHVATEASKAPIAQDDPSAH